jgi:hypothetical protein
VSVHPPDPLDLIPIWLAEADTYLAKAATTNSFEDGWLLRKQADACQLFAGRLQQHMKGDHA